MDQWRRRYDLIECAGSDAHTLEELGRIRTRFEVPINSTDELVRALNAGLCSPWPLVPSPVALSPIAPSPVARQS